MFVLVEKSDGGALELQEVAAKQQLPFEELVVIAGRTREAPSRQMTCVSARVKPLGRRVVLVLPVPVAALESADATAAAAVQILDVGEVAAEFAHDVRSCFPTLVRRNPLASDSGDESDESDEGDEGDDGEEGVRRASTKDRKRLEADAAKLRLAELKLEAHKYMRHVRVKVLRGVDDLSLAFQIHDHVKVCAALRREEDREREAAGSAQVRCHWLCVDLPALSPLASPPVSRGDSGSSAPPHNFALLFSHAVTSPRCEQFLSIPVPRTPQGYFPSTATGVDNTDEDGDADGAAAEIFCDATVLSLGAKREATVHGGGKTPAEMVRNIRMRHASGTFCTLVEPTTTWEAVAAKHAAFVPTVQGELRLRRVLGPAANAPLELLMARER